MPQAAAFGVDGERSYVAQVSKSAAPAASVEVGILLVQKTAILDGTVWLDQVRDIDILKGSTWWVACLPDNLAIRLSDHEPVCSISAPVATR
jgi:hypothetical protein